MTRMRTTLAMTAAALAIFAFTSAKPASADMTPADYRAAMRDLIRLTDTWTVQLDVQVSAMSVKPELACTDAYLDLLRHGGWLADDLRGSALSAPELLRASNEAGAAGFDEMLDGATLIGTSCDGTTLGQGTAAIEDGKADYFAGIAKLRTFTRRGSSGTEPSLPGSDS